MALDIVIVTGQSGSGKTTAIRALEDQGYFCVDNMLASLVDNLITALRHEGSQQKLAMGIDVRAPHFLQQAPDLVQRLRKSQDAVRLVYLEARDEALIQRYSETRRVHPMDRQKGLRDAIVFEREQLATLRELADAIIDTSSMSPHELRAKVTSDVAGVSPEENLRLAVVSFGFKYGLPLEADMVLDVRFLRNPFFVGELKAQTGLDEAVRRYVLDSDEAGPFLTRAEDFLTFLLPHYQKEGKRRLTVAVGCTGGQHRSVAIAAELAARLRLGNTGVDLRHRDVKVMSVGGNKDVQA